MGIATVENASFCRAEVTLKLLPPGFLDFRLVTLRRDVSLRMTQQIAHYKIFLSKWWVCAAAFALGDKKHIILARKDARRTDIPPGKKI